MKSQNFEFLRARWPELATLGAFAETYAHTDPASALVKLRAFAENLTKDIFANFALATPIRPQFIDLLNDAGFRAIVSSVIVNKLHAIRTEGNKAAHGGSPTAKTAIWILQEAYDVGKWLAVYVAKASAAGFAPFVPPSPGSPETSKGELQRQKKDVLEKLAAQEQQLATLLTELEAARAKVEAAERQAEEIAALRRAADHASSELAFDEAKTRERIIDHALAAVGWDVGAGLKSTASVGKEIEVSGQPTTSGTGFVDYVLWDDDGLPLAVIEAKKTAVDPERGRKQAKLYADALEKSHGRRPAIYYTNGYDIWLWDDAAGYPPRKVYGFYSKDSLQYLVRFQRSERKSLTTIAPNDSIAGRLYQLESIKRVAERFEQKHRKALIVQATGTGKTRVAIALADLLIRAGWAKRILFLCDRKELRRQAKNAFAEHLPSEPVRVVSSTASGSAPERIFISTYPAMAKVFRSFDVGYFDLIIADESHRSIYNVYGDLFAYFDCMQVGLTATPVSFVTRNTFSLFNCEGGMPTSNYNLETAIEEEWLTPFEVFEHTTKFLRDGIRLDGLTPEQIEELEDQGEDPSTYDFSAEQVDKVIYNKDTNRAIIRNLMENGLRDASGQTIGKSIIFARNHEHAVLLSRLFDEMYPQYGGKFCQVIDNYDPRAEQLIDDFKGEGDNEQLTIAISVDMLDTGIDIPEILNLVFAKPVKSPVKFWQMIGRGTRLRPDLFGPGKDKSIFRIFDHWGNFERFESGYQPAEPTESKALLHLLFEERLRLAEAALRASEIPAFDMAIALIAADIAALPEESIAVRERWREKRQVAEPAVLSQFSPTTVALLRQTIAPLMQWRNIEGKTLAHRFDLLIARLQTAVLTQSADVANLRIDVMEMLDALQMHLNPVKERAEVIKRVKSPAFWAALTVQALEEIRQPLREIVHYRAKGAGGPQIAKTIDVSEDEDDIVFQRRATRMPQNEMAAYRQLIEAELKKHFETDPVLQRIRAGEPVSPADLAAIVALVHTQNPTLPMATLNEFFASTTYPLEITLRQMVGLAPEIVRERFAAFVAAHPSLTAKQTHFLNLLQNHLIQYGFITVERLYDQPFTVIDADGPEGVFDKSSDLDDLMTILSPFTPREREDDQDQNRTTH